MAYVSLHIDSEFLGANTNITVILPEKKGEQTPEAFYGSGKKYKVLWLFHGGHGDCTDWIRKTKIELYACEKDLVVVCPSAQSSFYQNWPTFGPGYYMKDFFFHELMPLIYGWFPVSDRKEDNYIAGLSMGGVGTLTFLLEEPERFSAAAVLSGTPLICGRPKAARRIWSKFTVIWPKCTAEGRKCLHPGPTSGMRLPPVNQKMPRLYFPAAGWIPVMPIT